MERFVYGAIGVLAFIAVDWYVRRWLDRKYGK
jgi:hypothetical protein